MSVRFVFSRDKLETVAVEGELEIVSVSVPDRMVVVKGKVKSSVLISALSTAGFGAEVVK